MIVAEAGLKLHSRVLLNQRLFGLEQKQLKLYSVPENNWSELSSELKPNLVM